MKTPLLTMAVCGALLVAAARGQGPVADSGTVTKERPMNHHTTGTFEVKLTPQTADEKAAEAKLSRFSLAKEFQGGITGTGAGEMLAAGSPDSSGCYVAIERVSGTLDGRSGSFLLRHLGTMTRGAADLNIAVVPDSGTGQLVGLTGTFTLHVVEGKHLYDFDYTLPGTP